MHRPIFLTRPTQLPPVVEDWLWQREIKEVIMIGGTTAIGEPVETALDDVLAAWGHLSAERWSGADRYATAADVARNAYYRRALDFDVIGIATGEKFPDALGGGAACGYYGSPLLLSRNTSVPTGLSDFLADHEYAIGRGDIFGGADVVGETTRAGIRALLK